MGDPLGTPIGNLPSIANPPMGKVSHKSDMTKIDGDSLSYVDILKNLEQEGRTPQMPPGGGGLPPPLSQQQQIPQQQQYEQFQAPQQYYQEPPPQQYYQGGYDQPQSSPISNFWVDNRMLLLVTALVFVVMLYVAPKLKSYVPQLATDGNLNVVGIATISLLIGLSTQVVDKYV